MASAELDHSLIQAGQALHAQLRLLADTMLAPLPRKAVCQPVCSNSYASTRAGAKSVLGRRWA